MATQLDLQEQEQLDALKAFWKQYGNLITTLLVLLAVAYAGWNFWNYWQREQGLKAGAMYEELDKAASAGDVAKVTRVFGDLQNQFGSAPFAQHGALLAAQVQADKGQADAARATLGWVLEKGSDELKAVARLRLASLQAEAKQFDEALKTLSAPVPEAFQPLLADRRGDVLLLQGKRDEAKQAFQTAYAGLAERLDYKRLVELKLISLGAAPGAAASAPAAAASGASR